MDDLTLEEALAISEAVQKHKADAWEEGFIHGMQEMALLSCVTTDKLQKSIQEGLKKNPFRK